MDFGCLKTLLLWVYFYVGRFDNIGITFIVVSLTIQKSPSWQIEAALPAGDIWTMNKDRDEEESLSLISFHALDIIIFAEQLMSLPELSFEEANRLC